MVEGHVWHEGSEHPESASPDALWRLAEAWLATVPRAAVPDTSPAGWYPDPLRLRYWDGHAWTDHTFAAGPPVAATRVVDGPEGPVVAEPEGPTTAESEGSVWVVAPEASVIAEPEAPPTEGLWAKPGRVVAEPVTPVVAEPVAPVAVQPGAPFTQEPEHSVREGSVWAEPVAPVAVGPGAPTAATQAQAGGDEWREPLMPEVMKLLWVLAMALATGVVVAAIGIILTV
jgi:uncharacterized protein DUF2510